MRIRVLLPLLLSAALASPALAQMPDIRPEPGSGPSAEELEMAQQRAMAWQAYGLRVAGALGRSDGARDLALATLLEATTLPYDESDTVPASAAAERWRALAESRGAGDVITQQLLLAAAVAVGDEVATTTAARRWQALAPGNLAPLLHQGLDPVAVLAAAAQSNRNAPDPYPMLRWAAQTLARHPPTKAEWAAFGEGTQPSAAAHAATWASSLPVLLLPDHRGVLEACTGRQLNAAGRGDACRVMSNLLLARPQTVLDERIGLSMARALTRSSAERMPLDARRRGVDWRQEQMMQLATDEDAGAATAAAESVARALADPAIDTEDALVRRLLSEARLAQEPPPDWLAPWQQPRR